MDLKYFNVNHIISNQNRNKSIDITRQNIMFSLLFENKELQNNFHRYFTLKYGTIDYNFITNTYTKNDIFDFEKCT